jgi:hypothetical protein
MDSLKTSFSAIVDELIKENNRLVALKEELEEKAEDIKKREYDHALRQLAVDKQEEELRKIEDILALKKQAEDEHQVNLQEKARLKEQELSLKKHEHKLYDVHVTQIERKSQLDAQMEDIARRQNA